MSYHVYSLSHWHNWPGPGPGMCNFKFQWIYAVQRLVFIWESHYSVGTSSRWMAVTVSKSADSNFVPDAWSFLIPSGTRERSCYFSKKYVCTQIEYECFSSTPVPQTALKCFNPWLDRSNVFFTAKLSQHPTELVQKWCMRACNQTRTLIGKWRYPAGVKYLKIYFLLVAVVDISGWTWPTCFGLGKMM